MDTLFGRTSGLSAAQDRALRALYRRKVDLVWNEGSLVGVRPGGDECDAGFAVPEDLFPPLCLGHRTWRELRHLRPDVMVGGEGALLVEALFPPRVSWIHEQY